MGVFLLLSFFLETTRAETPMTRPALNAEEKAIVEEAQRYFKKAKTLKPPSAHMQKKMQSGVDNGKK